MEGYIKIAVPKPRLLVIDEATEPFHSYSQSGCQVCGLDRECVKAYGTIEELRERANRGR